MNKAETSAVTADDDAAGDDAAGDTAAGDTAAGDDAVGDDAAGDDAAGDDAAGDAEVRSGLDLTKAPPRNISSDCIIICPHRPSAEMDIVGSFHTGLPRNSPTPLSRHSLIYRSETLIYRSETLIYRRPPHIQKREEAAFPYSIPAKCGSRRMGAEKGARESAAREEKALPREPPCAALCRRRGHS